MWFLAKALLPLLLLSATGNADSTDVLHSRDFRERSGARQNDLEPRANCLGKGNFVIYESGSEVTCVNGYVVAACFVLIGTPAANIISSLSSTVSTWITNKVTDASAAGPQAKRSEDLASPQSIVGREPMISWGDLFSNNTAHVTASAAELATFPVTSSHAISALELHDDGFSATFSLLADPLTKRADCYEQIHVHYWAAASASSTVLTYNQLYTMIEVDINYSYSQNYAAVCYEMTNNGNWDGFLRVCYNYDASQIGCYSCGGHNN